MSVASILKGFTDEPPLEENDDLFDLESKENEWKKILYDALIDDLMSEDKVFDPGICVKFFFSNICSPLPFSCFVIYVQDCPDFEDSCARGFVHRLPRNMKTLVLVVLSIVNSSFNPYHAYIWESDIMDLID
nr:hypothetical protein [Tanacetum cinerariifolium]